MKALNGDDAWDKETEAIVPTSYRTPKMTPADRLKYITALWPTNMAHITDAEESLKYYGFQVRMYMEEENNPLEKSDEEKGEEVEKGKSTASVMGDVNGPQKAQPDSKEVSGKENQDEKVGNTSASGKTETQTTAEDAEKSHVTASGSGTAKEENWVQCDKCLKWRKLPGTNRRR
jgi:hypothetical protein